MTEELQRLYANLGEKERQIAELTQEMGQFISIWQDELDEINRVIAKAEELNSRDTAEMAVATLRQFNANRVFKEGQIAQATIELDERLAILQSELASINAQISHIGA